MHDREIRFEMRDKFAAKREENIRSKSRTKFAWEQQLSYLRIMSLKFAFKQRLNSHRIRSSNSLRSMSYILLEVTAKLAPKEELKIRAERGAQNSLPSKS